MLSTGSRQCVTKRRRNFPLHKKPYAVQIYPYCIIEMCILKLHLWFFTGIGLILFIFNIRPVKKRGGQIFEEYFKTVPDYSFLVTLGPPPIVSYWKISLKTWYLLRVSFSPQHPQCSGLKWSWCQGPDASFLESSRTVNIATLLLYETGKQSLFFLSVLTPSSLSLRHGGSLELHPSTA